MNAIASAASSSAGWGPYPSAASSAGWGPYPSFLKGSAGWGP